MKYCRKLARLNSITYASRNLINVRMILLRSCDEAYSSAQWQLVSLLNCEVSAIFGMVILMTFVATLGSLSVVLPLAILLVPLYTSLFTKMVAHKKKIQTYKQKAV